MIIMLVSEEKDRVYNLSELIPEMMEVENMTLKDAIDYFTEGLNCNRYGLFSKDNISGMLEWIVNGKGNITSHKIEGAKR